MNIRTVAQAVEHERAHGCALNLRAVRLSSWGQCVALEVAGSIPVGPSRMQGWPRLDGGQVMERLELSQSARTAPTVSRMAELENSLGVIRGRSVETPPEGRGLPRAAGHRPLPHEYRQLAKGAQENVPQHSDASPAPLFEENR